MMAAAGGTYKGAFLRTIKEYTPLSKRVRKKTSCPTLHRQRVGRSHPYPAFLRNSIHRGALLHAPEESGSREIAESGRPSRPESRRPVLRCSSVLAVRRHVNGIRRKRGTDGEAADPLPV